VPASGFSSLRTQPLSFSIRLSGGEGPYSRNRGPYSEPAGTLAKWDALFTLDDLPDEAGVAGSFSALGRKVMDMRDKTSRTVSQAGRGAGEILGLKDDAPTENEETGIERPLTDSRGIFCRYFGSPAEISAKYDSGRFPGSLPFVGKFILKDNLARQTTRMRVMASALLDTWRDRE
jgi:hypothetical protein